MQRTSVKTSNQQPAHRRGAVFVMAAIVMIMVFAFTSFTVDIGYVALTKNQLQNAADAGALAGLLELAEGLGHGATMTDDEAAHAAALAAVATAGANRAAEFGSCYADATRDVRVGNYSYDSDTQTWVRQWGVTPYNMIEVTLHRDQAGSPAGDGPLGLFFAPVMGITEANLSVKATAVIQAGDTLGITEDYDGRYAVLPIALDVETWERLINDSIGSDRYMYDQDGDRILNEPDGILEVNLYPESWGSNPSNRGTIDLGLSNNSTADIARQILDGLNDDDMEAMGGELSFPGWFNGDPGLSTGIEDELEFIKGEPRMIPLFERTNALGGGRLDYYVVDFVPIRILDVQLDGNPNSKHVTVQPATLVADEVISGEQQITGETVFSPGRLIRNE